ncbi:hypothetical protein D3C72_1594030 [compost metagenome]
MREVSRGFGEIGAGKEMVDQLPRASQHGATRQAEVAIVPVCVHAHSGHESMTTSRRLSCRQRSGRRRPDTRNQSERMQAIDTSQPGQPIGTPLPASVALRMAGVQGGKA